MWEITERTQVASTPGRVRQVLDDLARADDGPGLEWWFAVAPSWQGSEVEHGCRAPREYDGDLRPDDVRPMLVATLAEVKRHAEAR